MRPTMWRTHGLSLQDFGSMGDKGDESPKYGSKDTAELAQEEVEQADLAPKPPAKSWFKAGAA